MNDTANSYYRALEEEEKGHVGIEVEETAIRVDTLEPYEHAEKIDPRTGRPYNTSDAVRDVLGRRGLGHLSAAEAKPAQLETGHPIPSTRIRTAVDMSVVCSELMTQALRTIGRQDDVELMAAYGVPPVDTPTTMAGFSSGLSTMYQLYSLWIMMRTEVQGQRDDLPPGAGYPRTLAPSGYHRNHRIPTRMLEEAALAHGVPSEEFNDFIRATYFRVARGLAADEAVLRGLTSSTPFGAHEGNTVLRPDASWRALQFPTMTIDMDYPGLYDSPEAYRTKITQLLGEDTPLAGSITLPGSLYAGIRPKTEDFGGRIISFNAFMESKGFNKTTILELISQSDLKPELLSAFKEWIRENQTALFEGSTINRLELRYPEGGKSAEQMYQEMLFEHLRMLHLFRDREACQQLMRMDPAVVRANNLAAMRHGLDANLTHPLTGRLVKARDRLAEILREMGPMIERFPINGDLEMIHDFAKGAPTVSEQIRAHCKRVLGPNPKKDHEGNPILPPELTRQLLQDANHQRAKDFEAIRARMGLSGLFRRAGEIPQAAEDDMVGLVSAVTKMQVENDLREPRSTEVTTIQPTRRPTEDATEDTLDTDLEWDEEMTSWVVCRTQEFIRMGAVSTGETRTLEDAQKTPTREGHQQSLEAIAAACDHYCAMLTELGLSFTVKRDGPYPYVEIHGRGNTDTMFMGHLDVVEIQKEDQFDPKITSDVVGQKWLRGRGSADMITAALNATRCLAQAHSQGLANIPGMLIVFNEENGELDSGSTFRFSIGDEEACLTGTRDWIAQQIENGRREELAATTFIALERTNDDRPYEAALTPEGHKLTPAEMVGRIAYKSRGAMVMNISANAIAAHAGGQIKVTNLAEQLPRLQEAIIAALKPYGVGTAGGFTNQVIAAWIQAGREDGNTLPTKGHLEIAIRTLPDASIEDIKTAVEAAISNYASEHNMNLTADWKFADPGPSASADNLVALRLSASIGNQISPDAVKLFGKPHASSARIAAGMLGAPGFVWSPNGGLYPHGSKEAVLIDSIPVGAGVLLEFLKRTSAECARTEADKTLQAETAKVAAR